MSLWWYFRNAMIWYILEGYMESLSGYEKGSHRGALNILFFRWKKIVYWSGDNPHRQDVYKNKKVLQKHNFYLEYPTINVECNIVCSPKCRKNNTFSKIMWSNVLNQVLKPEIHWSLVYSLTQIVLFCRVYISECNVKASCICNGASLHIDIASIF